MLTGCGSTVDRSDGNWDAVAPKKGDLIATFEIEGHGTIKAVLFPDIAPVGVENFQKLADKGFYNGLTIHRVMKQFMFQGGSLNGNGTGGAAAVNGGQFGIETSEKARHFYGALCYANAGGKNSTQFYIVNANEKDQFNKTINNYNDAINECKNLAEAASSDNEKSFYEYYASRSEAERDSYAAEVAAMDPELRSRYEERGGVTYLDGGYTVFGQVYEGFDVIESISNVEVESAEGSVDSVPTKPVEKLVIKSVTVSKFK